MKRNIIVTACTSLFVICITFAIDFFFFSHEQTSDKIKVGFVYEGDEGIPGTNNFIRSQHILEEQFGNKIEVMCRSNVIPDKIEQTLDDFVAEGCSLIFTTNYTHSIPTKEAARKYPDVQFCQAFGDNAQEEPVVKNYHTFMGEIYQGRYISGLVAGLKLKQLIDNHQIKASEAKIGYIGAYPYPEIISGYTAFLLGVRAIVPEATMTVVYSYTWGSFSEEKACAEHLINENCIIIAQHTNSIGPAIACEQAAKKNLFHIGYNQSMTDVAPQTSLISTRINWTPYILGAVEAMVKNKKIENVVKGKSIGTDTWAGFDKNWVQMLEVNSFISAPGTEDLIEKTIQGFKKGKISVFHGDYIGINPYDENDTYNLKKEYHENKTSSSPTFNYILKDIITIDEEILFQ